MSFVLPFVFWCFLFHLFKKTLEFKLTESSINHIVAILTTEKGVVQSQFIAQKELVNANNRKAVDINRIEGVYGGVL